MARPLRLGLAMGGGTSQGTFSGAALTEAIKLLVLYGDHGAPHHDVRIDAVSGASAGTITLAILVRGLMTDLSGQEARLRAALTSQYGADFGAVPTGSPAYRCLLAAQHAQELQEALWTRYVHMDALLGGDPEQPHRTDPGIINRRLIDDMAREFLQAPAPAALADPPLLARRILFAAALANLTPLSLKAASSLPASPPSLVGLVDALTSQTHRDFRIFDLNLDTFDAETLGGGRLPGRWRRYHVGAAVPGQVEDLRSREAWGAIAATSIASGAFPFGFAPVVLTRFRHEFGEGLWPEALHDREAHPFTYVDGGTFNNEPLREAFRLSAHLDASRPWAEADRKILFVDPNLSWEPASMRVPVHREYDAGGQRLTSLSRLFPHLGTMFQVLRNESQVRDGDRAYQTRRLFAVRGLQRRALRASLDPRPAALPAGDEKRTALVELLRHCGETLQSDGKDALIPGGSLSLAEELERVAAEEGFSTLRGHAKALVSSADPGADPNGQAWLYLGHCLAVDLGLGLEGIRKDVEVVAIGPVKSPANAAHPEVFDVPNEAVATFAGFMSPTAQCFTLQAGRYCAFELLKASGLINPPSADRRPKWPEWKDEHELAFRTEAHRGIDLLGKRLEALLQQGLSVPIFEGIVVHAARDAVVKALRNGFEARKEVRQSFELRIEVPGDGYYLLHPGVGKLGTEISGTPVQDGAQKRHLLVLGLEFATVKNRPDEVIGWRLERPEEPPKLRLRVRAQTDREWLVDLPATAAVRATMGMVNPVFFAKATEWPNIALVPPGWALMPDVEPLERELLRGVPDLHPLGPACP